MSVQQSLPGLIPTARQLIGEVVDQQPMARNTYVVRIRCPELARQIRPGQFFMVRDPNSFDPLLGRPFALYDTFEENGEPAGIEFGYIVVGKLTSLMTHWTTGDLVALWGPLGNGFPEPGDGHLLMVAGGIGQTPFLAVAREALGLQQYGEPVRELSARPDRLTLCYGVRSQEYLAGISEFTMDGLDLQIATDDGSAGHHGFVTELLQRAIDSDSPPTRVFCCGPEPMMHAVQKICINRQIECWLSLETPMACGFGACFSCVSRVKEEDGSWDYKRTCVEGPVFLADRLWFDE
ncbi:MAG TPA: dihydroorotate dehydrogenase electron transfer subunit [Planctomycetaceae bacterium]|nr:dihydroorotate dehydrogenase electron transfer subunit [Planctomycetaceae bacterium]